MKKLPENTIIDRTKYRSSYIAGIHDNNELYIDQYGKVYEEITPIRSNTSTYTPSRYGFIGEKHLNI